MGGLISNSIALVNIAEREIIQDPLAHTDYKHYIYVCVCVCVCMCVDRYKYRYIKSKSTEKLFLRQLWKLKEEVN